MKIHSANIHDTVLGCEVFEEAMKQYPTLKGVCADAGCRNTMDVFVTKVLEKTIAISARITHGWAVLAQKWVVEKMFS